jgi:hypothetical protein
MNTGEKQTMSNQQLIKSDPTIVKIAKWLESNPKCDNLLTVKNSTIKFMGISLFFDQIGLNEEIINLYPTTGEEPQIANINLKLFKSMICTAKFIANS